MEYMTPAANKFAGADIVMTNAVPSNAIARTDEEAKQGGGNVRLTGSYTGAADAAVDVQIVDGNIEGAPSISAPSFAGVGNGTLTNIAADAGLSSEVITLQLQDRGTETRKAEVAFQNVVLRARTAGPRNITVAVARNLVLAETPFAALHDPLPQDAEDLRGDQWNWGAALLAGDGTVPADAPRIVLGDDHQVFRHYREFDPITSGWLYNLSPKPPRAIPAGARVRAVTGDYAITVTDATDPGDIHVEEITGVTTLYAALVALRASAIVEVIGAVVFDATPGGQAAVDLSVMTQSYCASIARDGGELVRRGDISLVVAPDAPTETLTLTCGADGITFAARGDISGPLPNAIAGQAWAGGHYSCRIPLPPPVDGPAGPQILVTLDADRGDGPAPQLCAPLARVGRNARAGVWEYEYKLFPAAPCPCDDVPTLGPLDDECLGIEIPEGTSVTEENRLRRRQRGTAWLREFTAANTPLHTGRQYDIDLANAGMAVLFSATDQIVKNGKLSFPEWESGKLYALDQIIQNGNFRYAITGSGTSGGSPPTFPTTVGDAVTADGVTYECIGLLPLLMLDAATEDFQADCSYLRHDTGPAAVAKPWEADVVNVTRGTIWMPSTPTGFTLYAESGGTSGSVEPSPWPTTPGAQIADGTTIVWTCREAYWLAEHVYAVGDRTVVPNVGAFVCRVGGESGETLPTFSSEIGRRTQDGDAEWECVGQSGTAGLEAPNRTAPVPAVHLQRVKAAANDCMAAAGLAGNFEVPGGGDGCSAIDPNAPGAFLYTGSDEPGYTPIYDGFPYIASKPVVVDGEAQLFSTMEFGFNCTLSCPPEEGDKIKVVIWNVGAGNSGYQDGDQFMCLITHAAPLALAGAQLGNDTLTWACTSSTRGPLPDHMLVLTALAGYNRAFVAAATYAVGTLVRPATPNGYCYRITVGGLAGAAPTFPTTVGATVTTGGVTLECVATDPGLAFDLAEGGIRYALGDIWEWALEGGHMRWRVNGGAWSDPIPIAPTVELDDGLSAVFAGGRPASWVAPDTWSFLARALSGAANLRLPDDSVARWTGSTVITITPDPDWPAAADDLLLLIEHTIPADATITITGSNDDWDTTAFTRTLVWRRRNMLFELPQSCADYRIAINRSGEIQWLPSGTPLLLRTPTRNAREVGVLTRQHRWSTSARRGGLGGSVQHVAVRQSSLDALLEQFEDAMEHHAGRMAMVPNRSEALASLVRLNGDVLEIGDRKGFEPTNTAERWMSLQLQLDPAA